MELTRDKVVQAVLELQGLREDWIEIAADLLARLDAYEYEQALGELVLGDLQGWGSQAGGMVGLATHHGSRLDEWRQVAGRVARLHDPLDEASFLPVVEVEEILAKVA